MDQEQILTATDRKGLSSREAALRLERTGPNSFRDTGPGFWRRVRSTLFDPMLLLLVGAAILYFVLGKGGEGFLMIGAIIIITSVSFYQQYRSGQALKALRALVEPRVRVLRDGSETNLPSANLVPGDVILLSEGEKIPADARVLQANDLSVNESLLTGEAFPVEKGSSDGQLFQGTLINAGQCVAEVTETGMQTALGKLGKTVTDMPQQQSALQQSTFTVVRRLSLLGLGVFVAVFVINLLHSQDFLSSLLAGLALAMAAVPEEIPVAFSTFLALGAGRLSRQGIITRQPQTLEKLGAVGVLCLDKTGTITENRMELRFVYNADEGRLQDTRALTGPMPRPLLFGTLSSEIDPFDEMEKAICRLFRACGGVRTAMVHEYPLAGRPPMMTHVYGAEGAYTAAAKGAPERILPLCGLNEQQRIETGRIVDQLATQGFRVLAVASAENVAALLPAQEDYNWRFEGLLALYDPPKAGVAVLLQQLRTAGIRIMLLTGDHPATAAYIANATGIADESAPCTGEEVLHAGKNELTGLVRSRQVFARMTPEAKRSVIEALRADGTVVGMTGDGVNDAPSLKAADIGIAMGHRGTELSRQAADLVLSDDRLEKILYCITLGRTIFENIRKVARYIVAIHLPIFLVALVPLLAGWRYQNILSPIHVIFLELIMGPTCSLFYEREEPARLQMETPPRHPEEGLLARSDWYKSIGLGVAVGTVLLLMYYWLMQRVSIGETRTCVFAGMLFCNVLLTFCNRSTVEPLWRTWPAPNPLKWPVLLGSLSFIAAILALPLLRRLFELEPIPLSYLAGTVLVALAGTLWLEPLKRGGTQPAH
ncbi:cation-translocating P-type ATPase [Flaviaesturariibacter terrae]